MNWTPKNVVLVMFAGGWLVFGLVALVRGQPIPAPPVQILPLLEAPAYHAPFPADPNAYYAAPGRAAARAAPAPRGDRERLPAYDPDFGTLAVSPGDDCYGQNCRVQSLTGTPAVLFANLPSCDASRIGQMRYTSDQGWVQCNGTAPWTGFGGSGSSTCTGDFCLIGDGGTSGNADGGLNGVVRALRYISTFSEAGSVSTGRANFNCDNNPASSSPCVANFSNATEIGGKYPDPNNATNADVYIGAMQRRNAGAVLTVLNNYGSPLLPDAGASGPEITTLQSFWNGDLYVGGNLYLAQLGSGGRVISPTPGYFVSAGVLSLWNNSNAAGNVIDFYKDSGGTAAGSITSLGGHLLGGVATVSLPTCNAGAAGTELYDSTLKCLTVCDGTSFKCQQTTAGAEELWNPFCVTCATDVNFVSPLVNPRATNIGRIEGAWESAGSGGSTNVTVQVYNTTDASSLCTCDLGPCNTTARTPLSCTCSGTTVIPAGKTVAARYSSKGDCVASPQVTGLTIHLTP